MTTPTFRHSVALFALPVLLFGLSSQAQLLSATSNVVASAYGEVSCGPNSRVMQRTTTLTNAAGVAITRTNSYVECATGMSVLSNGVWVSASPQIQITASGAQSTGSQTPAAFAANLNTSGAIDLMTPDGFHMTSDVAALAYFDGVTNVIIATPQDSIGQLLPGATKVLYTNAFNGGINADVLYDCTRAGLSQTIVIRQQLPPPASFGLTARSIWLQAWTEFTAFPTVQISETVSNGDQSLNFGQVSMRRGKAFSLGTNSARIPVTKQWFTSEGRTFLIESVYLNALVPQLNQLPAGSGAGGNSSEGEQSKIRLPHPLLASLSTPRQKTKGVRLPAKKLATKNSGPMRLAQALPPQRGVVVDYDLSGTVSSFTFQSDTTYFIVDALNISGAATYEGGTVVKFTNSPTAGIAAGSVVWDTAMYRPAIFTGKDDDTIGAPVSGSTGNPTTNFYGNIALDLSEISSPIVSNARFSFLSNVFLGDYITLRDVQLVNCDAVFNYQGFFYTLENVLLADDNVVSDANAELEGFSGNSVTCQNVTADNCGSFEVDPTSATFFTNCIFTDVGDWRCGTTYTNSSVFLSNNSGVFQTVGAGNYYLADDSPYRSVGTTNVDVVLLSNLQQKTTYPPVWLTNTFTNDTVLSPQAQRENAAAPDLGYGYAPIDFMAACVVSNATLLLTNGVALAYYNNAGVWLQESSQIISQGTPNQHNYFAYYELVQEQSLKLSQDSTNAATALAQSKAIIPAHADPDRDPSLFLRLTTLSAANGSDYVMSISDYGWVFTNLTLRDCEIYGAGADWYEYTLTSGPLEVFENNLFYRTPIDIYCTGQLATYNNLIVANTNADVYFANFGVSTLWTNQNNAFDGGDVYMDGAIGYNAYLNGSIYNNTLQSSDIVTNITWVTGPPGNFCQPTSSPLINAGSACATNFGLYHYTTTTNQVPETNSIVDIGLHYIALGANGLPLSASGDGIGDYLKDSNGDGIYNTGDLGNWLTNNTAGDGINDYIKYIEGRNLNVAGYANDTNGVIGLQVYTPLR